MGFATRAPSPPLLANSASIGSAQPASNVDWPAEVVRQTVFELNGFRVYRSEAAATGTWGAAALTQRSGYCHIGCEPTFA